MAASSMRRLASDQSSLRRSPLPPNYLFPLDQDSALLPDDLSQLTILLAGPHGTPYSQGLWRLHLKMPEDYPQSPPKASFRTRIWHPNVEESTGSICVDTLKKDWHTRLTLRDVLITISCLLIQPNPDSALNSAAGSLLQDDYEDFARQARLMTSIHAPIPRNIKDLVQEAKLRGEENPSQTPGENDSRPPLPRQSSSKQSVVMKKKALLSSCERKEDQDITDDEDHDPSKENDPSLSSLPVSPNPPILRKNALGKRPLSTLPTPIDLEIAKSCEALSNSEQNIAANSGLIDLENADAEEPLKKSPKLVGNVQNSYESERRKNNSIEAMNTVTMADGDEEKESVSKCKDREPLVVRSKPRDTISNLAQYRPGSRKASNTSSTSGKGARVGIRRL